MDYDDDEEFGELCIPFLKAWEKAHEKTAKWIYIPFEKLGKSFCELPNAELWFCGCCAILVPFIAAFLLLFITSFKAVIDLSLPTNKGITILGKTTISLRGNSGNVCLTSIV